MSRRTGPFLLALLVVVAAHPRADAAGISVDAGVTPAKDRWIFRTMLRSESRGDEASATGRAVDSLVWNNVLAFGFRSDLTLLLKQPVHRRDVSMAGSGSTDTGRGDLGLLAKYRIVRRNTRESTFGLAGTVEVSAPTGDGRFTSDTWDIEPGLYGSFRRGRWAADLSAAYRRNGLVGRRDDGLERGNRWSVDCAVARQLLIRGSANTTVAPVLELSYRDVEADRLLGQRVGGTREKVLYLSPGVKWTHSSLILEALVRLPVDQAQDRPDRERNTGYLLGLRKMF